jgi:hypothetical protein
MLVVRCALRFGATGLDRAQTRLGCTGATCSMFDDRECSDAGEKHRIIE